RIELAAHAIIDETGIIGLRMQDVADRAEVSVPLIHKYFGDRIGLLTQVLGDKFEENDFARLQRFDDYFSMLAEPTIRDFVVMFSYPPTDRTKVRRWTRMQILAASVEIPALRKRLNEIQLKTHNVLVEFIDRVQRTLNNGEIRASSDALAIVIQTYSMGAIMTDLLSEAELEIPTVAFQQLVQGMLENAFSPASPPSLD
ncbi:MAG: TetR/AcrR family transcriptional regulator, partial [Ilumatobacteraceae bacterium]